MKFNPKSKVQNPKSNGIDVILFFHSVVKILFRLIYHAFSKHTFFLLAGKMISRFCNLLVILLKNSLDTIIILDFGLWILDYFLVPLYLILKLSYSITGDKNEQLRNYPPY